MNWEPPSDRPHYGPVSDLFNLAPQPIAATPISRVYKATRKENGEEVTIRIGKISRDERMFPQPILQELTILSELGFPHIIKTQTSDICVDHDEGTISFAFEPCVIDVRRLYRFYANEKRQILPEVVTKSVMFQLLLALDYLHERSIAHCNINTANCMIVPQTERRPGILKLVDFEYSRVISKTTGNRNLNVVHPWYRAPEVLLGDTSYDESIDIWAAGCVFAELLTGSVLFQGQLDQSPVHITQLLRIVSVLGTITESDCANPHLCTNLASLHAVQPKQALNTLEERVHASQEALELLSAMLTYNAHQRITANEALKHAYFSNGPICAGNIGELIPEEDWAEILGKAP